MSKVETKEDLKVGHYYRTTEDFFRVDSIINGEPYGSIYDIYQIEPVIITNYPLSLFVEKFGCIEIFEEEYEETLQRITTNLPLDVHPQMISNQAEQTRLLRDCTENRADLITRNFSRIRYGNNSVEGWIARPCSKGGGKAPKKQA